MTNIMGTTAAQADPTAPCFLLAIFHGAGMWGREGGAGASTCAQVQSVLEGTGTLALHRIGLSFRLEVTRNIGLD